MNQRITKPKRLYSTVATMGTLTLLLNFLPEEVFANQEQQVKITTQEERVQEFVLSDWSYTETDATILLTAYKGSSTSLYVPGEYNGKQIIIRDFKIFPSSMTHLTLAKINGIKVGLQTTDLSYTFFF